MDANPPIRPVCSNRVLRTLFLVAGSLFLVIGIVGIVVPMLPTTPLLMLAATCYARSSNRFYRWLVANRVFGRYLDDYLHGRRVPWKVKAGTLLLLWGVIVLTAVMFVQLLWVRVLLLTIAVGVTAHVVTLKGRGDGSSKT